MLAGLGTVVSRATAAFDDYDYTTALEVTERFFWSFCDDYVELVKERAYGARGPEAAESAKSALALALHVQLRLLAPFLPYVTEEVWSWWQEGSVHRQPWPTAEEIRAAAGADPGNADVLHWAAAVLREVRKAKSESNLPLRTAARSVQVLAPDEVAGWIGLVKDDLREAGVAEDLQVETG